MSKKARNARGPRAGNDPQIGRFGELLPQRGFSRYAGSLSARRMSGWRTHDGIMAISGCHLAPLPGTQDVIGPQWLVTVSLLDRPYGSPDGHRATQEQVRRVVEAFCMPAFDEDNHHPGVARHLWCPIDETARLACECKTSEQTVLEPDGYRWTTDVLQPCRGCYYEGLFGLSCPIHKRRVDE